MEKRAVSGKDAETDKASSTAFGDRTLPYSDHPAQPGQSQVLTNERGEV